MKPDISPEDFARLADLLSGESTPAEAVQAQQWLEEHPEQQHVVETLAKIRWAFSPEPQPLLPVNPQQAVQAALARAIRVPMVSTPTAITHVAEQHDVHAEGMAFGSSNATSILPRKSSVSRLPFFSSGFRRVAMPVAAGLMAVLVLVTGWYTSGSSRHEPATLRVSRYTTENGKQATVTLPDGSRVLLNAASRLEVPADYDQGNRTVRLVGEALFTIAHQGGSPFTVLAGPSRTRVLGTSFTVRYYPTDTAAIVAVRDGKVSVHSTVLTAAQQLTVGVSGTASSIQTVNPARFSFASGLLVLDNLSLTAAIPELNRWFDADIRLGDPTLARTITIAGNFQAGSVAELAGLLEQTFDVRVVRNGRILTIYP